MARGEDSVGIRNGKGLPSTYFKDVPSCVDFTGVKTWLKPVGEPQVEAFWKKFSFPPNVWVLSMFSEPCVMVCTD